MRKKMNERSRRPLYTFLGGALSTTSDREIKTMTHVYAQKSGE